MLKFEIDEDQLKDKTDDTVTKMHILLQEYCKNVVDIATKENSITQFKLIESACVEMFFYKKMAKRNSKDIDRMPKMTGGE